MAVMTAPQRQEALAQFMSDKSSARDALPLTKADLKAALDAIDDWVVANASAFNTAIPQPARGALSTLQKAELLMYVVSKRFKVGA